MKQTNLTLPENLRKKAEVYVQEFGYKNMQELATEAIRDKVMFSGEYDEDFTKEEVKLVEDLLEKSLRKGRIVGEKELNKVLS